MQAVAYAACMLSPTHSSPAPLPSLLQLTLSALAFGIATRNVDAICGTPLMQHERVQGLLAGLSRLVQMALLLLVGFPLPAAVHVDRGGPVGCRTAVLFLQVSRLGRWGFEAGNGGRGLRAKREMLCRPASLSAANYACYTWREPASPVLRTWAWAVSGMPARGSHSG